MEYIHKLPFMLGALMAIVVGAISYAFHVSQRETYIRMAICIVVFYIIGIGIRGTITGIMDEIAKKKEAEENEKLAEMEKLEKEKKEEALKNGDENSASVLDFKIDETFDGNTSLGEDFSPLTVKEILKSGIDK